MEFVEFRFLYFIIKIYFYYFIIKFFYLIHWCFKLYCLNFYCLNYWTFTFVLTFFIQWIFNFFFKSIVKTFLFFFFFFFSSFFSWLDRASTPHWYASPNFQDDLRLSAVHVVYPPSTDTCPTIWLLCHTLLPVVICYCMTYILYLIRLE